MFLVLFTGNFNAEAKTYKMVFVPASEKGDESDYTSLIAITEKLTGLNIDTIKVTDYNAAVEAIKEGLNERKLAKEKQDSSEAEAAAKNDDIKSESEAIEVAEADDNKTSDAKPKRKRKPIVKKQED